MIEFINVIFSWLLVSVSQLMFMHFSHTRIKFLCTKYYYFHSLCLGFALIRTFYVFEIWFKLFLNECHVIYLQVILCFLILKFNVVAECIVNWLKHPELIIMICIFFCFLFVCSFCGFRLPDL